MTQTILPDVSMFAPIEKVSKQPDGTLLISAVASSEAIDDQGEQVMYSALKKAAPAYMQWAAVNEMHQPSAVGTTVDLTLDDAGRRGLATIHVVDADAVKKVETGVYKGVSIEGRKNSWAMGKVGGKSVRQVTDIDWTRLSLVDRPSNPDSILTLAKRAEQEAPMQTETPETPAETVAEEPAEEITKAAEVVAEETPSPIAEPPITTEHEASADASVVAPLAKSATDDAAGAGMALNIVNLLIEKEAGEATVEPEQIAALRGAQAALLAFMGQESAEIGTPDDAPAVEDAPQMDMAYATVAGDLQKRAVLLTKAGARNSQKDATTLRQIRDLVDQLLNDEKAEPEEDAAAEKATTLGDPEDIATLAKRAFTDDDTLAKVASTIVSQIGEVLHKSDLDAMKAELLEGMDPMQKQIAQIAKMAAPGGPVRYAERDGRLISAGAGEPEQGDDLATLRKFAASSSLNPAQKAALGEVIALAQISEVTAKR